MHCMHAIFKSSVPLEFDEMKFTDSERFQYNLVYKMFYFKSLVIYFTSLHYCSFALSVYYVELPANVQLSVLKAIN